MKKTIFLYIGIAIIFGMILLHFLYLENDPPLYFVMHGQSLLTDPYHLTHAARNEVLFDNSNLFDYFRWDVFKNSLISGMSYPVFSLFDVSRVTANFTAVVLHLSGLLLFIFGLNICRNQKEVLFTSIFLLLNAVLFFYAVCHTLKTG